MSEALYLIQQIVINCIYMKLRSQDPEGDDSLKHRVKMENKMVKSFSIDYIIFFILYLFFTFAPWNKIITLMIYLSILES